MPKTHLRPWKVEKQSATSVLWRKQARYSRLEDALKAVERADLIRGTAMRVVDLDRDLVITVRHG